MPRSLAHGLTVMTGRDPHEVGRTATPLELFYDLSFVVAFSALGSELAHALAEGHIASGIVAFCFGAFGVCWAWINYAWFASAYDTDDWLYRILVMVQMAGVVILGLGIPNVFKATAANTGLGSGVVVAGYVVIRVATVVMWLRARAGDPTRRKAINAYVVTIVSAQVVWCALVFINGSTATMLSLTIIPLLMELVGPMYAERVVEGTPWHPHHIAERYGLLVIITLGEVLIGAVAALSPLVNDPAVGWTADAIVLLAAGLALTMGLWWLYFGVPWAEILHFNRSAAFKWGYGHIVVFAGITAIGAGLHVAQFEIERHTKLSTLGTISSVAIPLAVTILAVFVMYSSSVRSIDTFHIVLITGSAACVVTSLVMAASGAPLIYALAVLAMTPWVTVVGYELLGHRHIAETLSRGRVDAAPEDRSPHPHDQS